MTHPADFWNPKFETEEYIFGTEANSFIKAAVPPARDGQTAYAPADGEGRNGVYLAEIGYQVTSTDIADKAVEKAKKLAQSRGVSINAMVGDIMGDPTGQFDVVIVSFMHFYRDDHLRFVDHIHKALAPGGLLALEGYSLDQIPLASGGPKSPDMLYTREQLKQDFAALDILLIQDAKRCLNEGPRHQGEAATIQLIARKGIEQ
jgi:SAM-dependent methyltransferase